MKNPLDPSDPKNHPSLGSYLKYCRKRLDIIAEEIRIVKEITKSEEEKMRVEAHRIAEKLRRERRNNEDQEQRERKEKMKMYKQLNNK